MLRIFSGLSPLSHKKYTELKSRPALIRLKRLAFKNGPPKSGTVKLLFDYAKAEELLITRPLGVSRGAVLVPMVRRLHPSVTAGALSNNNKEEPKHARPSPRSFPKSVYRPTGIKITGLRAAMESKTFDILKVQKRPLVISITIKVYHLA